MVGIIIHSVLFNWFHCNQITLLQGVGPIVETAKEVNGWTASMIITFIAVLSTFALYRLAIHHHKEKIKENEVLRSQIKQILTSDNQEVKKLKVSLGKCRQQNKELKDEIVAYLIKSVSRPKNDTE